MPTFVAFFGKVKVAAGVQQQATANLNGTSTVFADGDLRAFVSAYFAGDSGLVTSPLEFGFTSATLSSTSTFFADGDLRGIITARFAGDSTFYAVVTTLGTQLGQATLSAASTLSVTTRQIFVNNTAIFAGASTLFADGDLRTFVTARFAGDSSLFADGDVKAIVSARLAGSSTLSASVPALGILWIDEV